MRVADLSPSCVVWKASNGRRVHLNRSCRKLRRSKNVKQTEAAVCFDDKKVCGHCATQSDLGGLSESLSDISDL